MKFQGDILNFCDFIQVFVFTTNHHLNVSLKFQTLISEIRQYFLLKNVRSFCSAKASLTFSIKNISVFAYKVIKHLMNELTS